MEPMRDYIKNTKELEFVIFCIENVADRLQEKPEEVYRLFTKESDLLASYIVPNYDVLHTQSKEYIIDDIIEVMRGKGIKL